VFSFLLPTLAGVLASLLDLQGTVHHGFWALVMVLMALLWAFSTWFYASRLFSLAAFVALSLAVGRFASLLQAEPEVGLFLFSLATLAGLGGVFILKRWRTKEFALPLFALTQVYQVGLVVLSLILMLFRLGEGNERWLLLLAAAYPLLAAYYSLSNRLYPGVLFPWLAAGALLPLPLAATLAFDPPAWLVSAALWFWGAVYLAAAEAAGRFPNRLVHRYAFALLAGSLPLFGAAAIAGFIENTTVGFVSLLAAGAAYTAAQVLRPRPYVWTAALVFGLGAYFSFYSLPWMAGVTIDLPYRLLIASLLLLAPDLVLKRDLSASPAWRWPARLLGGLLTGLNLVYLFESGLFDPRLAWICLGVYTLFFSAYALRFHRPPLGYLPAGLLAASLFYLQHDLGQMDWLYPWTALAVLYYAAGSVLRLRKPDSGWAQTLRSSGLALGLFTSLTAPFQGGLGAAIPVALAATLFAVEAFTRRQVWWSLPANLLYLLAYFMLLWELNVSQPQFYSVGAALLGLLMHYLLTRSGSRSGAFAAGMLSQLVLLGTTYVQLVSTERLAFFLVLFLQALVVLLYGVIIRSRSLVGTPIFFAVLAVVTVLYSTLKGIGTVLLIGCTGILLLMLGILAVVLRERLKQFGERFTSWQA
jgi:hypothetical protein